MIWILYQNNWIESLELTLIKIKKDIPEEDWSIICFQMTCQNNSLELILNKMNLINYFWESEKLLQKWFTICLWCLKSSYLANILANN